MIMILASILAAPVTGDPRCRETHIHADGHVTERLVDDPGDTAITTASTSGTGRNSASVSASSSSTGAGSSSATTDNGSRRVTVRRDGGRCTITIDERPKP